MSGYLLSLLLTTRRWGIVLKNRFNEVRKSGWKRLGHLFRMQNRSYSYVALYSPLHVRGRKDQKNLEKIGWFRIDLSDGSLSVPLRHGELKPSGTLIK